MISIFEYLEYYLLNLKAYFKMLEGCGFLNKTDL